MQVQDTCKNNQLKKPSSSRYIGRSIKQLLRTVEALKTVEDKGAEGQVVVPANWVMGKEMVFNTVEGRKEYFSNLVSLI